MEGGCRAAPRPCRPICGRLPVARSKPPNRSIIKNFDEQEDFTLSDLLRQHHIVSLVNVPVLIAGAAWGVLEIDSTSPRDFSQDTIEFLTAAAALIAAFVQRHTAEPGEAARVAAAAVEAQNRDVLLREMQHRVKNSFQLILASIAIQKRRHPTVDVLARVGSRCQPHQRNIVGSRPARTARGGADRQAPRLSSCALSFDQAASRAERECHGTTRAVRPEHLHPDLT